MKLIKTQDVGYKQACDNLIKARQLRSKAEKLERAGKNFIDAALSERGIKVEYLSIGECVTVQLNGEDCLRILVRGRNAVDLGKLLIDYPEVEKACRRDFPTVYYDPVQVTQQELQSNTLDEVVEEMKRRKRALELSIGSLKHLKEERHNKVS